MRGKRLFAMLLIGVLLTSVPVVPTVHAEQVSVPYEVSTTVTQRKNVYIDMGISDSSYDYLQMDAFTYNNGVHAVVQNPDICKVSTEYAMNVACSVNFQGLQSGETDVYIQDQEGNVYQKYHVTVTVNDTKVYVDYPAELCANQVVSTEGAMEGGDVLVYNPELCSSEISLLNVGSYANMTSLKVQIKVTGKAEGMTYVRIRHNGNIVCGYRVSVEKNAPENIVRFEDDNLKRALASAVGLFDEVEDGYVTKEEMAEKTYFDLKDAQITNLSGMEYAINATSVDLSGNTELENVDVLYQLKNLSSINFINTNVSGEDILELAKVAETISVREGIVRTLPSMLGKYIQADNLTVSVLNGTDVIEVLNSEPAGYEDCWKAIGAGDAVIRISCGDAYKDVKVHVDGIDADQPLGEVSDRNLLLADESKILDSTGRLWNTYPEVQLETTDVEKYVSGWVYGLDQAQTGVKYGYALRVDGTLWSDGEKIADNVKETQGRYALTTDNALIDIYNGTHDVQIGDVQKWIENVYSYDYDYNTGGSKQVEVTYVLKTDKTLWRRIEKDKGETPGDFVKIVDNVKDLSMEGYGRYSWGVSSYLLENGNLMSDDPIADTQTVKQSNLAGFPGQYYYQELDGNSYVIDYGKQQYVNVGKVNIEDATVRHDYNPETHAYTYYTYYLTEDKTLYCYTGNDEIQAIAQNVEEICEDADYLPIYRGTDGLYRDLSGKTGTVDTPIKVSAPMGYLQDYGVVGDYNFCDIDGATLLTHVKICVGMWGKIFLVRTDGTVWKLEGEGIPVKILDLDDEVNGNEMTDDQKEEALSDIASADQNATITVAMESAVILPAEILKAAQEKNVTLECSLADGTKWTIACGELTDAQLIDTDLTVVKTGKEDGVISADVITELAGTRSAEQLNFTDGGFDLAASVSLAMDSALENMKCVAVGLEEEAEKLLGVAMVRDGQMTLALSQAKDCALVYGVNGDTSADGRVNITDLMQTLHHVSGRTAFGVVEQGMSDVNLNGRTDITDLMHMLHYTSGRNETL